jgi:hypothetical protein
MEATMKTTSYTMEPATCNQKHAVTGIPASEAHRVKKLEEENLRLKKQVANLTRDNKLLREVALSHW